MLAHGPVSVRPAGCLDGLVVAAPLAAAAGAEAAQGRTLAWLVETAPVLRVLAVLAFEDAEKPGAAAPLILAEVVLL